MQFYGGNVHLQDSEVLDDESVASCLDGAEYTLSSGFCLVAVDDSVQGQIDFGSEPVSVVGQDCDVLEGVTCGLPCSERGTGDIYSIGTAVDGRDADVFISCRS